MLAPAGPFYISHGVSSRTVTNGRFPKNLLSVKPVSPHLFSVLGHKTGIIFTETLFQSLLLIGRKLFRRNGTDHRRWAATLNWKGNIPLGLQTSALLAMGQLTQANFGLLLTFKVPSEDKVNLP